MDIDKLFKVPKLPSGAAKRRMPANPTPDMLKRMKFDTPTEEPVAPSPPVNKGKGRAVTVEDVNEDEDEDGNFAPGGDADYFAEEDEDGRFFGGGLTDEQKKILNIFDSSGAEGAQDDPEEMNITSIRRLLLRFERAVSKNQDQRSKYPNDPTKFIDSESDLDMALKSLLPLAQAPALAYPELVRSGTVVKLVDLLTHENVDIAIDVVEVVHELTDEDVGDQIDENEEGESKEETLKVLIDALELALRNIVKLENQIFELLVQNFGRLDEAQESDRQGIFHTLGQHNVVSRSVGIFENLVGFSPALARTIVNKTTILPWLLNRITSKTYDENRGYASELLAILLQNDRENRLEMAKHNGVETALKVLSQYRRRDPPTADETEFMENVFDALCSALMEPEVKKAFLHEEGVDLMVIMMKEKLLARSRSIKALDHALAGPAGAPNCEAFVEALGLKTLFSLFMGKSKKQKSASPVSEDTTHVLGIMSSLFTNLASDSPPRVRLLTKFVESDYEKVDRLLEIREHAEGRLAVTNQEIEREKKELLEEGEEVGQDEEDLWYLRRLDGGLHILQTVDYILGWISMEDDGIRGHAQLMLGRKNKSLRDIIQVLIQFRDNIGDEADVIRGDDDAPPQKMILQALVDFLEGC
ncbi:hypothetical protein BOTBODRAFT_145829 [Botryobasidium botryosum FD-172 SS1]|uniref:Beta-catenin-like protein 1 N-terminal domain-containing protein n=1 Tax=Botryobasidium botryosum (strain FD-172 SS1) TaxID=930990 RepID=A0A067MFA7_BOTB1|nr:hypothetical protein BOTBODRAFT_145829 [Botryobasidium botryosum FD-172 SS1]